MMRREIIELCISIESRVLNAYELMHTCVRQSCDVNCNFF